MSVINSINKFECFEHLRNKLDVCINSKNTNYKQIPTNAYKAFKEFTDKELLNVWTAEGTAFFNTVKYIAKDHWLYFNGYNAEKHNNKPTISICMYGSQINNVFDLTIIISNSIGKRVDFSSERIYTNDDIKKHAYQIMHFVNQYKYLNPDEVIIFCDKIMSCYQFQL